MTKMDEDSINNCTVLIPSYEQLKESIIPSNVPVNNQIDFIIFSNIIDYLSVWNYEFFDKNRLKTCLSYHYVQRHYKIF